MRATFVEHRVRGRVWLVLSMIAGAGAVYVNDRVERREDTRDLHRATVSATAETPRVGGGPPVATPYFREPMAAPETVEGDVQGGRPVPRFPDVPIPIDEDEAGPPRTAAEDAIAPEVAAEAATEVVAEADASVEDAAPEASVATVDTGMMYDPNAPYITPVFGAPVTVAAGAPQPPEPVGAGGTAADPTAEMAGGISAEPSAASAGGVSDQGLVTAGGTAATPSATEAGGTPIGATGAGGGTATPTTTAAGSVPAGNAGAIDTSAFVPNLQNSPFATPQGTPFVVSTAPFAAAPGVVPFVGGPVPFFFFVPPVGAFGVIPNQ